jgi:dolichol-phosphate mannosyltransferase
MYHGLRVIALIPAHNEVRKIGHVVRRVLTASARPAGSNLVDALLVIDDASNDQTADAASRHGAHVLTLSKPSGVGAALRAGLDMARRGGFDVAVILAGNNKDEPEEIPRLLEPIQQERCDFVIGSRYVAGGVSGGDMPYYRRLATRLHPWLMSVCTRKRITESTNGFRAFRLSLLEDSRIDLDQRWLDAYGLEVYLLWKVLRLDYKHREVPCTKTYPSRAVGYTKMKPGIGWWSILSPIFLLRLGVRK